MLGKGKRYAVQVRQRERDGSDHILNGNLELRNIRANDVAGAKREARAIMQEAFGMTIAIDTVFVEKLKYW